MKIDKKNSFWIVFVIVLVAVFVIWMFISPSPEHIEDTNGADNFSLQQISEKDVVDLKMGTKGTLSTSETHYEFAGLEVSDGITYSSKKFTGVYLLHSYTAFKGSDIYVYLADFQRYEGNFAFYIVLDGKIIGEVEPDEFGVAEFLYENIDKNASVEYVLAAESASFSFIAPYEW